MNDVEALALAYRADSQPLALDASRGYDEETDEADELIELQELGYEEPAAALTQERWAGCVRPRLRRDRRALCTLIQARETIETEVCGLRVEDLEDDLRTW